jgi:GntR family phosphonate transport system transcriptional regulator
MVEQGISLWRQIGDALTRDIDAGALGPGDRLPADADLAMRFGVNRHTVRRALAHLQGEGLVRSERGRGTFVVEDVMDYRLGARTRFTQNLLLSHRSPTRRLLAASEQPASAAVAEHLALRPGAPVHLVVTLGEADGRPISMGQNYLPAERLPRLGEVLRQASEQTPTRVSITAALKAVGVPEYHRRLTRISARPATVDEARQLKMPAAEYALETESLDVDDRDEPVIYARTAFRSGRVQFVVET